MTNIHADNEFDMQKIKEDLQTPTLHAYSKEENIGVIERGIRTLKDKSR